MKLKGNLNSKVYVSKYGLYTLNLIFLPSLKTTILFYYD